MSKVQAVLFPIEQYTAKEAKEWLTKHNFHPIKKGHKTEGYRRYRLREPNSRMSYRTKSFGKGIKAVMEFDNSVRFI